jgi:hypothetical protein
MNATTKTSKRIPANFVTPVKTGVSLKKHTIKAIVQKVATNAPLMTGLTKGIFTHKIPAQPVKVAAKTATYGAPNRWPSEFTSANAIWIECIKQNIDHNSITKIEAYIMIDKQLKFENKKGELVRVNPSNVSIEINSYKKHLLNIIKQQVAV